MAKSSRMGGDPNTRMSNVMSGVERSHRGEGSYRASSTVRAESYLNSPFRGSPVSRLKDYVGAQVANPSKVALEKPKNIPSTVLPTVQPPVKKPVVAAKPVVKPVVKPVAKKLATVVSNVTNEKLSPAKKAMARAKPPATRFGVVTGKTTGTRVSGGGGYGGGGTRGGGSLSGQGSGSRSAGTSRTGGTRSNDPVRG